MAAKRRSTRLIDKANGTTGPRTRRPPETIETDETPKSAPGRKRSSSKAKSVRNKDKENAVPKVKSDESIRQPKMQKNVTTGRKRTPSNNIGRKSKQQNAKGKTPANSQLPKAKTSTSKMKANPTSKSQTKSRNESIRSQADTQSERKPTRSTKRPRSRAPTSSKQRDQNGNTRPKPRIVLDDQHDENHARRQRATQHRLFLVGRRDSAQDLADDNLTYVVMGTTGNIYYCTLTSQTIRCTCVDQRVRKVFCKHLLFVMLKVLKIPETHPIIKRKNAHMTYEELAELYSISRQSIPDKEAVAPIQVRHAWQSATGHEPALEDQEVAEPAPQREIASDDDCPICFELLDDGELLEYCKGSCGRSVHAECFGKWASSKQREHEPVTCVWCRQPWIDEHTSEDRKIKRKRLNLEAYVEV